MGLTRRRGRGHADTMRAGACVLAVVALGVVMVSVGSRNDAALELLSSHHNRQVRTGLEEAKAIESKSAKEDSERLFELNKLAAAADRQAKSAKALRSTERKKLEVSPSSKVDAETMLSSEAAKKATDLKRDVADIHKDLSRLAKNLRKEHHKARQEMRLLHHVKQENRDGEIALHDREMKVLEARHDVSNAAKAGDVAVLRDAQQRLKQRKAIAKGARAQEEENKKMRDQIAARARLLRKRANITEKKIQGDKARVHNLMLMEREETAASKAIGARANLLRDTAALKAARAKYSSLAELLGDANSDHSQVEATLSKIASNIHTWKDLRRADEKDVEKRAKLYKAARKVVAQRSITLASDTDSDADGDEKADTSLDGESLLQVRAGAGFSWWSQRPVELEQELQKLQQQGAPMYAYVPQAQAQPQQMAYVPAQAQGAVAQSNPEMMAVGGGGQVPQQGWSPMPQQQQMQQQQQQQSPPQMSVQQQPGQMDVAQVAAQQEQQAYAQQEAKMKAEQQQQQAEQQQQMQAQMQAQQQQQALQQQQQQQIQQQQQQAQQPPKQTLQEFQAAAVEHTGGPTQAPPAGPAVLPGAVGDVPYVYNDKQYLPSRASTKGYPIVWVFADNKTSDPLYFGFQSADGVMHVYNEIKPHSVTRQQAFGT
jgi:hypothetical protein